MPRSSQPCRDFPRGPSPTGAWNCLHVKAELDDVAVSHDVVLALDAHLATRLGLQHRTSGHQVVEGDDLRFDETSLEISVDNAGSFRCRRAAPDRPRA